MPPLAALVLFVVVQLVPGWVTSALFPNIRDRLSLSARLAAAVALSIAQLMFVGLILISLGIATPAGIVAVNLVMSLSIAFVVRRRLRKDWDAAAAAARAYQWDRVSVAVVLIIGTVVGVAVWKALHHIPSTTSAWGYAADTAEILDAGGLPDTNIQYGDEIPFAATKTGGFAWLGALRAFTGIGYVQSLQLLPLALLFGAMVAMWGIFRSFAGRLAAAMGLFVMFFEFPAGTLLVTKFSRLTIEGAGITLGLLAIWAMVAADRERVPELRWLAAVMMVLAGLTHGVSAVMTVVFVASYQLARIILGQLSWRQIYRNAFVLGVVPGIGTILGLRLWSRASGFAIGGGGYELVDGVGDPTLSLRIVLNGRSILATRPPGSTVRPGNLFDILFGSMFGGRSPLEGVARDAPIIIALLVLALIVVTWLVGRREVALTAAIFLVTLFLIAIVFTLRYDLHVFRTHPQRREFPYAGIAVVGMAVTAVSAWRWQASRARQSAAIVLAGVLVVGSVGLGWARAPQHWSGGGIGPAELSALDWVREQTPEDSWILTNVRTTASFGSYAERNSLTEGDTPYIYPGRLTTTLDLLDAAQDWFSEPNLAFLQENGIDYVVAARRQRNALGGDIYARMSSLEALDDQSYLVEEAKFKHVTIYSVHP